MRKAMLTVLLATSVALPAQAMRPLDAVSLDPAAEQAQPVGEEGGERPRRAERPQRAERGDGERERERPQVADRANWSDRGQERQRAVEQQATQQPAFQQPTGEEAQSGGGQRWSQRRQDGNRGFGDGQRRSGDDRQRGSGDGGPRRWGGDGAARDQAVLHQQPQQDGRRDSWPGGSTFGQGSPPTGQVVTQHRDGRRDGERRWDGRRDGTQSRYSGTNRQWSNQWRQDRNYDWRHHRDRNRSVFRLGNYYDPYGSRYRHFSIGFSLFPSYYQSNYWLQDPWQYRLPPAYGPYRWVRYYDDALLVNVYTGQVADVIYSFFW